MSHSAISLTASQKLVWDQLIRFLKEPGAQVFILKGYAGTGKTFLLKKLVAHLNQTESHAPNLMAPTGRAAEVLRRVTGEEARTIHSHLYGRPQLEEHSSGSINLFFPLKFPDIPGTTLWIVDEASMLTNVRTHSERMKFGSGSLLNDLISAARLPYRKDDRILFVGDPAQLPPVNGNGFSPALDAEYMAATYGLDVQESELTDVLRQSEESGILRASMFVRRLMAAPPKRFSFSLPEGPGLSAISWAEFDRHFPLIALEKYPLSVITLTHSNDQAFRLNQVIRRKRFGDTDLSIKPGDWLMVDKNFYAGEHIMYNGTHVRVLELDPATEERAITLKRKGMLGKTIRLVFRKITIEAPHPETSKLFSLDILLLENSVLHPQRLDAAEQQALMVDFRMRHPNWKPDQAEASEVLMKDPYFNALQARYGYAITVHKAQGGEWSDVFVNFDAHFPRDRQQDMYRWAYTAVTRASDRLFGMDLSLFTPLPPLKILRVKTTELPAAEARYRYLPKLPDQGLLPAIFQEIPGLLFRHMELTQLAREARLEIRVTIRKQDLTYTIRSSGQTGGFRIPFDASGFEHPSDVSASTPELREQIDSLLTARPIYAVPGMPPAGHRRTWYQHIRSRASEAGWQLSQFHLRDRCDEYWFSHQHGFTCLQLRYDMFGKVESLTPIATTESKLETRKWMKELKKWN